MSQGVELWDRFVGEGQRDATRIDDALSPLGADPSAAPPEPQQTAELGSLCFRLATQALLLGAADVGQLAIACERALDLLATEKLPDEALATLVSSAATLREAMDTLANPDASGARTEGLPLQQAREQLEEALAGLDPAAAISAPLGGVLADEPASSEGQLEASDGVFVWEPNVDEDMLDLFFEEANERVEDLSVKLLDIEQRPDDTELLRDIFRDMHTVKGSSAMVALTPMNQLAHAAEDLVGELRDGARKADGPVVDALLAALDGLREIVGRAEVRAPLEFDAGSIVRRLRDPNAAVASDDDDGDEIGAAADAGAADGAGPAKQMRSAKGRGTIRVDFDKLDRLLNLVGELVLGRDGLRGASDSLSSVSTELSAERKVSRRSAKANGRPVQEIAAPTLKLASDDRRTLIDLGDERERIERVLVDISQDLDQATGRLDSTSDKLREQVMKLRMVPVGGVFRKHHRTVRDLANALGKRARLELTGEDTELDKLLVEALDEPLMHLVRNAVDHGIEPPDKRIAAGKDPEGLVQLKASHRGNQMLIEIRDDGKGIDPEALRERARERELLTPEELESFDDRQILEVIFRPGFSTAKEVTEVSGRGVGMDVVRQAIVTGLKGVIDIDSRLGAGSVFTLRLPLTLAIIQVLLARTAGEVFAIPLDAVMRTLTCSAGDVQLIEDREMIAVNARQVPLIRLSSVLELDDEPYALEDTMKVVLTEVGGEVYGLACDHLVGKKEIVIKSLGDILQNVPCAAGATLLGDRCALILDVPAIVQRDLRRVASPPPRRASAQRRPDGAGADEAPAQAPHVLLVEDSDIVRESLRRLLVGAGYRVTEAVDGVEGLAQAEQTAFDLVSTDVMMPRMDGYELTRALRATQSYKDTPIIMVTSKGERIDRVRGFDAGVDEYITKPHDRQLLLRVLRKLLGDPRAPGEGSR